MSQEPNKTCGGCCKQYHEQPIQHPNKQNDLKKSLHYKRKHQLKIADNKLGVTSLPSFTASSFQVRRRQPLPVPPPVLPLSYSCNLVSNAHDSETETETETNTSNNQLNQAQRHLATTLLHHKQTCKTSTMSLYTRPSVPPPPPPPLVMPLQSIALAHALDTLQVRQSVSQRRRVTQLWTSCCGKLRVCSNLKVQKQANQSEKLIKKATTKRASEKKINYLNISSKLLSLSANELQLRNELQLSKDNNKQSNDIDCDKGLQNRQSNSLSRSKYTINNSQATNKTENENYLIQQQTNIRILKDNIKTLTRHHYKLYHQENQVFETKKVLYNNKNKRKALNQLTGQQEDNNIIDNYTNANNNNNKADININTKVNNRQPPHKHHHQSNHKASCSFLLSCVAIADLNNNNNNDNKTTLSRCQCRGGCICCCTCRGYESSLTKTGSQLLQANVNCSLPELASDTLKRQVSSKQNAQMGSVSSTTCHCQYHHNQNPNPNTNHKQQAPSDNLVSLLKDTKQTAVGAGSCHETTNVCLAKSKYKLTNSSSTMQKFHIKSSNQKQKLSDEQAPKNAPDSLSLSLACHNELVNHSTSCFSPVKEQAKTKQTSPTPSSMMNKPNSQPSITSPKLVQVSLVTKNAPPSINQSTIASTTNEHSRQEIDASITAIAIASRNQMSRHLDLDLDLNKIIPPLIEHTVVASSTALVANNSQGFVAQQVDEEPNNLMLPTSSYTKQDQHSNNKQFVLKPQLAPNYYNLTTAYSSSSFTNSNNNINKNPNQTTQTSDPTELTCILQPGEAIKIMRTSIKLKPSSKDDHMLQQTIGSSPIRPQIIRNSCSSLPSSSFATILPIVASSNTLSNSLRRQQKFVASSMNKIKFDEDEFDINRDNKKQDLIHPKHPQQHHHEHVQRSTSKTLLNVTQSTTTATTNSISIQNINEPQATSIYTSDETSLILSNKPNTAEELQLMSASPKQKSIFEGASKDEILEYLNDAKDRVPEALMEADEVMVIGDNELIVVNQIPGAPATPISIEELSLLQIKPNLTNKPSNDTENVSETTLTTAVVATKTPNEQDNSIFEDIPLQNTFDCNNNEQLPKHIELVPSEESHMVTSLSNETCTSTTNKDLDTYSFSGQSQANCLSNSEDRSTLFREKDILFSNDQQEPQQQQFSFHPTDNLSSYKNVYSDTSPKLDSSQSEYIDIAMQHYPLSMSSSNSSAASPSSSSTTSSTSGQTSDHSTTTNSKSSPSSNDHHNSMPPPSPLVRTRHTKHGQETPDSLCSSTKKPIDDSILSSSSWQESPELCTHSNLSIAANNKPNISTETCLDDLSSIKSPICSSSSNNNHCERIDSGLGFEIFKYQAPDKVKKLLINASSLSENTSPKLENEQKIRELMVSPHMNEVGSVSLSNSQRRRFSRDPDSISSNGSKLEAIEESSGVDSSSLATNRKWSGDVFSKTRVLVSGKSWANRYAWSNHHLKHSTDLNSFPFEFRCIDCDQLIDMPSFCNSTNSVSSISNSNSSYNSNSKDLEHVDENNNNDDKKRQCSEDSSEDFPDLHIVSKNGSLTSGEDLERAYIQAMNSLPICGACNKKRIERREIISEFVETEVKYGRDLKIIRDEFCRPMQVAGLLTKDQIADIFLNLDELIAVNGKFCEQLCCALDEAFSLGDVNYNSVKLGKIFYNSSEMLHAFESYCIMQAHAACLLARLAKEKELLRIFLCVSQMENAHLRRMNLAAFLMVPVQRVTKYPLLFNRLYKVTSFYHKDREAIREAQIKVELHLEHINQHTKGTTGSSNRIWRRISSGSTQQLSSSTSSSTSSSSISLPFLVLSSSSSSNTNGSTSSLANYKKSLITTEEICYIKIRKAAVDLLKWDRDETQFVHWGPIIFASFNEFIASNKNKSIKFNPANALLVALGKPTWKYRPDLIKPNMDKNLMKPSYNATGIKEAALLLMREKNGRFVPIREPIYLSNYVVSTDVSHYNTDEESFELHEVTSKESILVRADTPLKTRYWLQILRYHAKDLGTWRQRRNGLSNVIIVQQREN